MAQIKLNLKKSMFVPCNYPLLFDYSHRWEFWCGSAGSGKSYTICQKIIMRCIKEPIRVLVCRRYASTLRNSCFALFKEILTKWKLTPYIKVRETDMSIEFPNGSKVIMLGLDTEEKLLSLTNISTVWIEEAYEVECNKVTQLNLRMRGTAENQQIIMSWNPISKTSWLYNFTVENPPQDSIFYHSTYKDNPFLNAEYVKALEELYTRNPAKAKVFCDGEWGVDTEGLIYTNWKVQEFNHAEIKGELLCGLDFGFTNDISAFVASVLVEEEGRIYIFKEYGEKGKTNQELVNIITAFGLHKSIIIADCAEPKSIEEMKRAGVQRIRASKKGADSILHGIQKLQNYQLIVHPSCVGVITELENYSWEKDKHADSYTNKPLANGFDHYMDALRYSLQCVNAKLKTLDKNLF